MAIAYIGNTISGVSGDTKPTLTANEKGVLFVETDTNKVYQWDTDSWNEILPTSAPILTTGRTIGMTGDVVWTSPSFTGSGNITAAAAIGSGVIVNADVNASAAIALSKTALVAGTGITLATNTLNVDAAQTQITSVGALNAGSITSGFTSIDVGAGAITTTGTITAGNLSVTGTTTTINSTNSTIADRLIELATGASDSTADAGIVIERGSTGNNAIMAWDESQDRFIFGTTTATGASTGDLSITAGNIEANLIGNVTGNVTGSAGSATGNAATATALANARTIGGTSFDGTGNIAVATATEATNVTASANNSTDETVYPTFVDGATGTQGIETDTGLTYNPSTGVLTTTSVTGNLTGNVTGNTSGTAATVTGAAQTAITSVGTLTALQVDNLNINGNTISSTAGTDLLITPLAGQQIVLDGTIIVDAGVVTGATSITSTALVGALTGNADTATALATARTIGGTSFDGTGNIAVALAATATILASARTIGGTSFDGSANIVPATITVADTTDTTSFVALFESATGDLAPKTDAGITYNAGTGMLTATGFTGPLTGNVTGNASGTAATVTGAAQSAITSLGTLTTLTVDDITINGSTISDAGALTIDGGTGITLQTASSGGITLSETVYFNGGSAGNPSITKYNDTNTGILFPTTDTIAITTAGTERLRVTADGNLSLGHDAVIASKTINPAMQIYGNSDSDTVLAIGRWSTNDDGPELHFIKSKHADVGSNTIVVDDDRIGVIRAVVSDGTDLETQAAGIEFRVDDGSPEADGVGGEINFLTAAEGTGGVAQRMTIDKDGYVGIGVTSPDQALEVSGKVHISGEGSAPSAPADGDGGVLYIKTDGKLYYISNEVDEVEVSSSGGGGGFSALQFMWGTSL